MANPNSTVQYLPQPFPSGLNSNWRKYIIQAATPNDTRLVFGPDEMARIPRVDIKTYPMPAYTMPHNSGWGYETDISFHTTISPPFPLWVEKVKVCLHQQTTYGCVKINLFNYGSSLENTPVNLTGLNYGQPANINIPVTIFPFNKLISNVLSNTDLYMAETSQISTYDPFVTASVDNIIQPESILRFGIQYAEGNAYGLKVFLVCWALECDKVG